MLYVWIVFLCFGSMAAAMEEGNDPKTIHVSSPRSPHSGKTYDELWKRLSLRKKEITEQVQELKQDIASIPTLKKVIPEQSDTLDKKRAALLQNKKDLFQERAQLEKRLKEIKTKLSPQPQDNSTKPHVSDSTPKTISQAPAKWRHTPPSKGIGAKQKALGQTPQNTLKKPTGLPKQTASPLPKPSSNSKISMPPKPPTLRSTSETSIVPELPASQQPTGAPQSHKEFFTLGTMVSIGTTITLSQTPWLKQLESKAAGYWGKKPASYQRWISPKFFGQGIRWLTATILGVGVGKGAQWVVARTKTEN